MPEPLPFPPTPRERGALSGSTPHPVSLMLVMDTVLSLSDVWSWEPAPHCLSTAHPGTRAQPIPHPDSKPLLCPSLIREPWTVRAHPSESKKALAWHDRPWCRSHQPRSVGSPGTFSVLRWRGHLPHRAGLPFILLISHGQHHFHFSSPPYLKGLISLETQPHKLRAQKRNTRELIHEGGRQEDRQELALMAGET